MVFDTIQWENMHAMSTCWPYNHLAQYSSLYFQANVTVMGKSKINSRIQISSEQLSSFSMAYQNLIGYSVPWRTG